jgi:hypothetical protein
MNPESLNSSTAGGRVLGSTKPAPLLVLACCWGLHKIRRTENKNQKEKPFTQNSLQNPGLTRYAISHGVVGPLAMAVS